MTQDYDEHKAVKHVSKTDSLLVIVKTITDTTIRMFGPVIIGALIGFWGENQFHVKFFATGGAIVGLLVAAILVFDQYKKTTKGDNQ